MSTKNRLMGLVVALFAVLTVAAGAGVNAQDVSVNYTPGTDFFRYTTYRWVEIEGAEKPDAIVDGQYLPGS